MLRHGRGLALEARRPFAELSECQQAGQGRAGQDGHLIRSSVCAVDVRVGRVLGVAWGTLRPWVRIP